MVFCLRCWLVGQGFNPWPHHYYFRGKLSEIMLKPGQSLRQPKKTISCLLVQGITATTKITSQKSLFKTLNLKKMIEKKNIQVADYKSWASLPYLCM